MCELTMEEKVKIIHLVLVDLKSNKDVGDIMRVKPILVSKLVQMAKKNKNFLLEMEVKEAQRQECVDKVVLETKNMLKTNHIIHKSSQIKHLVLDNHGLQLKNPQICRIFRERLGLKYKKVKYIPFKGNSEQNLCLR